MSAFGLYCTLLIISGILMLGLCITGFGGRSTASRVINGVFGAGFVGYGLYLALFFNGGTYIIFFKAFIVPILLLVNAFRNRASQPKRQPAMPQQAPMQQMPMQQMPMQQAPMMQQPSWQPVQPAAPAPTVTSDDVLGR